MKKIIIIIVLTAFLSIFTFAQTANNQTVGKSNAKTDTNSNSATSDIKMRNEYGSQNPELMSILRFEDIGLSKIIFSGKDLVGKNYLISIKEYTNGKLAKQEVVFDSKEAEMFKIKSENFSFKILTKITPQNTAKFEFQFTGFSNTKEYKVGENFKGFAQKDFLGSEKETSIPVNANTYILTYMMPYMKKDGSGAYCEVAQSGVNPEEFGTKYAIPTYFLIDIKFH